MMLKDPIVIVGMARSGTSALADCLAHLGLYAGPNDDLLPADTRNPGGYFELKQLIQLNEHLRSALGIRSNPCHYCPDDWQVYGGIEALVVELSDLITRTFPDCPGWFIKDIRVSLLMPIYGEVFQRLALDPKWVICVRNPLASAESAQKMYGHPVRTALGQWLQHTLCALRGSMGKRRRVIGYEDLLANPSQEIARILELVPNFRPSSGSLESVGRRLHPNLNHASSGAGEQVIRPRFLLDVYDFTKVLSQDPLGFEAGDYDDRILEYWAEFESWWSLPPTDLTLSSRLELVWNDVGSTGSNLRSTTYLPLPKPQVVRIEYDAPQGAWVEGQLSDWPGRYVVESASDADGAGAESRIELEWAPDLILERQADAVVVLLPRRGRHFRFRSRGGRRTFCLRLIANTSTRDAIDCATELAYERAGLLARIKELESQRRRG